MPQYVEVFLLRMAQAVIPLLAIAGVASFIAVLIPWCWRRVRHFYTPGLAKFVIAVIRAVTGIAAIGITLGLETGDSEWGSGWNAIRLWAVGGWLFWEMSSILAERSISNVVRRLAEENERLVSDGLRRSAVAATFHHLVNEKKNRVRTNVRQGTVDSRKFVREALQPEKHSQGILTNLAGLFWNLAVKDKDSLSVNFRVALYVEDNGQMKCHAAWDHEKRTAEPFRASAEFPGYFRLEGGGERALVVRCVIQEDLLIVENCENDPQFSHYRDTQKLYLRSMIAFPMKSFPFQRSDFRRAALVVDTNLDDFFREMDREFIRMTMREFAARLELEYLLRQLLQE